MVTLQNINFNYNGHSVFNNLNLEIKPGNIYGLLGKNGAGKSTMLNLISGSFFPQKGTTEIFQKNTTHRKKAVLQEICLLNEDNLDHTLSAREYLKVYAGFYPRFDLAKFYNIADEWQIRYQDKLANLSHGERKKFLIAFALATNCRLILLDEPTNGLDIPAKSIFRSLIANASNDNTSIIISSHQVRDLEGLIDPVIILNNGEIVLNQSIAQIEDKLYFGLSQTPPEHSQLLYSMAIPAGFAYVAARQIDADYGAKADLELLFNAVINHTAEINQLFGEKHA